MLTPDLQGVLVLKVLFFLSFFLSHIYCIPPSPRRHTNTSEPDYTDMIRTHDVHRFIRAPAQQFFSRSSMKQVEGRLVGCIKTLCQRLEEYKDTGKPVNMSNALYSLATGAYSDPHT